MKIKDKMLKSMEEGKTFYSFEFFPPRTEEVSYAQFGLHPHLPCVTRCRDLSLLFLAHVLVPADGYSHV